MVGMTTGTGGVTVVVSVSIASPAVMSSAGWCASLRTLENSPTVGTLVPMESGDTRRGEEREEDKEREEEGEKE